MFSTMNYRLEYRHITILKEYIYHLMEGKCYWFIYYEKKEEQNRLVIWRTNDFGDSELVYTDCLGDEQEVISVIDQFRACGCRESGGKNLLPIPEIRDELKDFIFDLYLNKKLVAKNDY